MWEPQPHLAFLAESLPGQKLPCNPYYLPCGVSQDCVPFLGAFRGGARRSTCGRASLYPARTPASQGSAALRQRLFFRGLGQDEHQSANRLVFLDFLIHTISMVRRITLQQAGVPTIFA